FCHVGDTVEALVRLQTCKAARNEIFNVGSTEEISILELAELVVRTLNSRSNLEHVPYDIAYAPGFDDMPRRRPAIDKLKNATGFAPRTRLRDMIGLAART